MRGPRGILWFGCLLASAVIANLASCAALESIPGGQCGNRVRESGEECDTVAPAKRFDGGGKGACGDQNAGAGACRFLCGQPLPEGGMATSVCPMDEVCGTDGICRPDPLADAPTGAEYQFSQLGPPVSTTSTAGRSLVAGDFDGDGLGDVVVTTPAGTELFLGSSKGLSIASSTELGIRGPYAARLTGDVAAIDQRTPYAAPDAGDPTDDLAFLFGGGVAVLTGQSDGTLTPAAYPKVDVDHPFAFAGFVFGNGPPKQMGMPPPPPISTPWIFLPYDDRFENQDADAGCFTGMVGFLYIAGGKPQAVKCFPNKQVKDATHVSNAVLAPIHVDPTNACGQFVTGFMDDDHVSVYVPCEAGSTTFTAWTPGSTVFPIALGGGKLSWGPLLYDVDGDGNLDVIAGAGDEMLVAYGTPTFHFTSQPGGMGTMDSFGVLGGTVIGWELVPSGKVDQLRGPVLAIGDVNGDGRPDFVTAQGVYVSTAPLVPGGSPRFYEAYQASAPSQVESAAFGDFNGDGLTDVALTFERGSGLETVGFPELLVLLTSSKRLDDLPLLDPYPITVDAPVFHVVSGDFNGDGVADIAFGQTTDVTLHHDPNQIEKSVDTITLIYGDSGGNFFPASMGNVLGMGGLVATDILFQGEPFFDGLSDLGVLFSFKTKGPTPQKPILEHHAAAVLPGQPGHLIVAPLGQLEVDSKSVFHQALPLAVAAGQFDDGKHLDFGSLSVETDQAGVAQDQLEIWRTPLVDNAIATASTFTPLQESLSTFGDMRDPSSISASATSFQLGSGGGESLIAAIAGANGASVYFGQFSDAGFGANRIGLAATLGPGSSVHVEAGNINGKPTIVVQVGTELFVLSDLKPSMDVPPVKSLPAIGGFTLLPRPARADSLILLATLTDVELYNGMSSQPVQGIPASPRPTIAVTDVDGDRLPDVIVGTHEGLTTFRMLPGAFVGSSAGDP